MEGCNNCDNGGGGGTDGNRDSIGCGVTGSNSDNSGGGT